MRVLSAFEGSERRIGESESPHGDVDKIFIAPESKRGFLGFTKETKKIGVFWINGMRVEDTKGEGVSSMYRELKSLVSGGRLGPR